MSLFIEFRTNSHVLVDDLFKVLDETEFFGVEVVFEKGREEVLTSRQIAIFGDEESANVLSRGQCQMLMGILFKVSLIQKVNYTRKHEIKYKWRFYC